MTDTRAAGTSREQAGAAVVDPATTDDDTGAVGPGTTPAPSDPAADGADGSDGTAGAVAADQVDRRDRLVGRLALALTLAPFVVAAIWLLVTIGGEYNPASDHALTELQVRDVGRHPVLVGLYSREDWNHPGPAAFYALAPFYWLTGGMSVGISLGALAINGGAVAAMGLLARRRGGTPLMLVTLLGSALLMRMLGADFLRDPWNCFVTMLPFGVLFFLVWSLWEGEAWALAPAAALTTYLAQAHVGFVALAIPMAAWGTVGLVASVARETDRERRRAARRRAVRWGLASAAILAVAWLPTLIETVRYSPGNLRSIWDYFRDPANEPHTLTDGWRVMSGQFGGAPEWLTTKRPFNLAGESQLIDRAPFPWLLLVLVGAGVLLWRRRTPGARSLIATFAIAFVLGVVAVARTVGPAFDYRLRWTYVPALLGAIVIGWAAWTLAAARWPGAGRRVLPLVALAGLGVVGAVNVVTAARAGLPQHDDSRAVASITDQVIEALPDAEGTVLVTDGAYGGAWHARGLVLQLERRGLDVSVPADRADEYGRRRVHADPAGVRAELLVTMDQWVDEVAERPGMHMIAEWSTVPPDEMDELMAERERLQLGLMDGERDAAELIERFDEVNDQLNGDRSVAHRVAVFVVEAPPA
jgi:hypothetical protein